LRGAARDLRLGSGLTANRKNLPNASELYPAFDWVSRSSRPALCYRPLLAFPLSFFNVRVTQLEPRTLHQPEKLTELPVPPHRTSHRSRITSRSTLGTQCYTRIAPWSTLSTLCWSRITPCSTLAAFDRTRIAPHPISGVAPDTACATLDTWRYALNPDRSVLAT